MVNTRIAAAEKQFKIDDKKHIGYFLNDKKSNLICVLLPGGGQPKPFTKALFPHAEKFNKLGFSTAVVYSSFGPLIDSKRHKIENTKHLVKLLKELKEKHNADGFIFMGFSNGGTGALQIAAKHPDLVKGILAVPGAHAPKKLPQGLPVYLRIGAKDQLGWAKNFDQIKKAIAKSGAVVDAKLLENAPHMFKLDWEEIQTWLKKSQLTAAKVKRSL